MATYVYIVWIDYNDNWHCWEEVGAELVGCMPWCENSAKKTAGLLTGDGLAGDALLQLGTADFIGSAREAYCIHATSRSKAFTLARRYRKAHRLTTV